MDKKQIVISWIAVCLIAGFSIGCKARPKDGASTKVLDPISEERSDEDQTSLDRDDGLEVRPIEEDSNKDPWNAASGLQPVYFAYDSYDITDDQIMTLEKNAAQIEGATRVEVLIEGHCDERGTEEYNLALGDRRARAARDYLVSLGIDENLLRTISYGESHPFAGGHDEDAWSQNRRAQFKSK